MAFLICIIQVVQDSKGFDIKYIHDKKLHEICFYVKISLKRDSSLAPNMWGQNQDFKHLTPF